MMKKKKTTKRQNEKKTYKIKMYIYTTNTDYDLLQDRPVLPSGR
jgi:hypothetical protein